MKAIPKRGGLLPDCLHTRETVSQSDVEQEKGRSRIGERINGAPLLRAEGLTLTYANTVVVEDFTQVFPPQKVTAIIGPNGCGKSTLLTGLARLKKPAAGQVLLDDVPLSRKSPNWIARNLALLSQQPQAPEGISVAELIRFGRQPYLRWWQQWSRDDQQWVEYSLAVTHLEDYAHRPLASLSGGQRQRAWLAMTIAQSTPLLLLDEPTSALDIGHQIEVFELIRHLSRAEGKTVIMVVHDLMNACRYADHLIAMHEGKIIAAGAPTDIMTSELMKTLYHIDCAFITDPLTQSPLLTRVRSCH
ncbi:Petrobactin import ATP-binding protein FpuD [Halomonadaceae bacterium LMG 33818]|uniref:ABC transporter ATP-binding protein n=1 Tax=Cernens ardua TaxID=3402176 RepID=UPI003EDBC6E5